MPDPATHPPLKPLSPLPALAHLDTARRLHAALKSLFDDGTLALARRCMRQGEAQGVRQEVLDPEAFDAQQPACYALALASAELLAVEVVLDSLGGQADEFDVRLALAAATTALQHAASHLGTLGADLDIGTPALDGLLASEDMHALRRAALATAPLSLLADAIAAGDREIGHVPLDEALLTARDQCQHLAANVIEPLAGEIHRQDLTVPESILEPLRALGVFGLSIPEAYGGSAPADGSGHRMMIVVTEALSEASLGAAGSLITRPEILSRALLAGGTETQKRRWLPAIAAGEPLCAIAITEPDFGSDVASLALRATPAPGGWLLNGAKTWCTLAGKAGLLMVVARTEADKSLGHRGLSVLLVEKPASAGHAFEYRQAQGGVLSGRAIPTLGYRGMHSFDLSFDDVFVPDSHVLGEREGVGKGFYFTMAGMTGGRMQTAARALGVMRAALRSALRQAGDRQVFGKRLIDHPLSKVRIAQMAARLAACRQLTYAVGQRMDQGQGRMEASLVKLFACRAAEGLTRDAMQLFGGLGYAEETSISRHFVDARVLSIFEGSEETLALKVVARALLEAALAGSVKK
jgi:(2S)-methylsuccinyl-CoA dehydrogenase